VIGLYAHTRTMHSVPTILKWSIVFRGTNPSTFARLEPVRAHGGPGLAPSLHLLSETSSTPGEVVRLKRHTVVLPPGEVVRLYAYTRERLLY